MKPNCYNRQAFKATVIVQDGWKDVILKEMAIAGGDALATRLPLMVELPDPMSKGCQQHGQKGEATLHPEQWDCDGCQWKPVATKKGKNGK